ncbi:hypothetical protein Bra1253DRAFT_00090 [Bradyrhizobium sp. WSM1253]|nr:hypothetical protein Bra1253DRAFT_00090 [Bradyrhizobium sp. WSM1253]
MVTPLAYLASWYSDWAGSNLAQRMPSSRRYT